MNTSLVEWGHAINRLMPKFPLTDHGVAKLAPYPAQALDHARLRLSTVYTKQDPFVYFIGICSKYCEENNLIPNYSQYKMVLRGFGISGDDTTMLDYTAFEAIKADDEDASKNKYPKKGGVRVEQQVNTAAQVQRRAQETEQIIQARTERVAAPHAKRNEIVAGIMTQDWSDKKKEKALEFFNLAWPEGEEPNIMKAYKKDSEDKQMNFAGFYEQI